MESTGLSALPASLRSRKQHNADRCRYGIWQSNDVAKSRDPDGIVRIGTSD